MPKIDLKMTIRYDSEREQIDSYEFADSYTIGEVSVIVATFKECLKDWGYNVTRTEE